MDKKNKNPNVPNLRFSNPYKLRKVRLGDICTITGGYAFDSHKMKQQGEYQIIKMGNLYNGIFDLSRNQSFINVPTKKELEYLIQKNDILITLTGTTNKKDYGYTVQIEKPKKLLLNQRCALIRASKVNEKYLFYLLNSNDFLKQFYASSTGGTGNQTNVSINDMLDFKVYISNENDQLKISNILNALDKKISTQIKIISDYTFLLNLLRDKLLYDKNHKKIKLSTLISIYNGYAFKSNNYKANAKYKIITIGNVTGDRYINLDSINTIDKLPSDIQQHQIINKGSILVSLTGNVGRTSICNEDDCLLNQRVALVKSKNINEKFIYHILSSSRFLNKMISSSQGAAQKNISTKDILNYEITLLSKERMEYVTLLLEKIENKINYEKNILEHLYTQKQYFLKNMFI